MKLLHIIIIFFLGYNIYSQNTVGTITNEVNSYNGYTLFSPNHSTETYLINNCGEIINQWSSSYKPGVALYLLENGNLLRTGKTDNSSITFGGVGGKIELFDWDNNLLWNYTYSTNNEAQHHDIYPLPNGNILMLAVTTLTQSQAVQIGRDPSKLTDGKLYNEQILELKPIGTNQANIVWQWDIVDHLIQDFDSNKNNFGVVSNNPQLLNINYLNDGNTGEANWLHINSLQYNENLNQIILSSRLMNEIYIIDHSTTSAEAASHSGGIYGKGGDFLYRWGNPEAYNHGNSTDKKLFGQHYPHWIPNGLKDAGKIIIFNNGAGRGSNGDEYYSSIDIIDPPESSSGFYTYDNTEGYGPISSEWTYTKPIKEDFYSPILSSGQRLPNGNTLICVGFFGRFFEIDSDNNIVWEYTNPDTLSADNQLIQTQGELPSALGAIFRAIKYSTDYSAFNGKDLSTKGTIELGRDLGNCSILNNTSPKFAETKIFPNPVKDYIYFNSNNKITSIKIYNILGELILNKENLNNISHLNLTELPKGIYIIKAFSNNLILNKKFIKT